MDVKMAIKQKIYYLMNMKIIKKQIYLKQYVINAIKII